MGYYNFSNKSINFFAENKMYYRERVTLPPRTHYATTENTLRSLFHKMPQN